MTKGIELTQGKYALVDDEDYKWLNQWKWHLHKSSHKTVYAVRHQYLGRENGKQRLKMINMSRLIMEPNASLEVDHINGNGLDNRRCNLRIVTRRQNQQNRHENSSSKYPGVYWEKHKSRWRATIRLNGKTKHIGYFKLEKDAFNAYKNKCEEIGEEVLV